MAHGHLPRARSNAGPPGTHPRRSFTARHRPPCGWNYRRSTIAGSEGDSWTNPATRGECSPSTRPVWTVSRSGNRGHNQDGDRVRRSDRRVLRGRGWIISWPPRTRPTNTLPIGCRGSAVWEKGRKGRIDRRHRRRRRRRWRSWNASW